MEQFILMILVLMPLVGFSQEMDVDTYHSWIGNYSFSECDKLDCPNFKMEVTQPSTRFGQYEFELEGGAVQWMHYAKGYVFTSDYKRLDFYTFKDEQGFHEQGEFLFSLQLDCDGKILTYWYDLEISDKTSGQELIIKD